MAEKDTRPWFWGRNDEDYSGDTDTRDGALEMARDEMEPGDTVVIGRMARVHPEAYINTTYEGVLDDIEECFHDQGHDTDCDKFECDDESGARKALQELLRAWAKKWLYTHYRICEDTEEVTL